MCKENSISSQEGPRPVMALSAVKPQNACVSTRVECDDVLREHSKVISFAHLQYPLATTAEGIRVMEWASGSRSDTWLGSTTRPIHWTSMLSGCSLVNEPRGWSVVVPHRRPMTWCVCWYAGARNGWLMILWTSTDKQIWQIEWMWALGEILGRTNGKALLSVAATVNEVAKVMGVSSLCFDERARTWEISGVDYETRANVFLFLNNLNVVKLI